MQAETKIFLSRHFVVSEDGIFCSYLSGARGYVVVPGREVGVVLACLSSAADADCKK